MLVRNGQIELTRGPRENHSRPAIDPLFRSAARTYGSRTVGVILSGALYDGAAGLASIKAWGGVAIVQDPEDASFSSMPQSALRLVDADRILTAGGIGEERMRQAIDQDFVDQASDRRSETPTMYTCPDCGGVLWQEESGAHSGFRCHVGHAYAPEVLLAQKADELETALWSLVRLLRERATLTRQLAAPSLAAGHHDMAVRGDESARLNDTHARVIRELLKSTPLSTDQTAALLAALDGPDPVPSGST